MTIAVVSPDLFADPLAMWFMVRLLPAIQDRSGNLLEAVYFSLRSRPPRSSVGRLFARDPLKSGEGFLALFVAMCQEVHCAVFVLLPRRMRKS